MLWTQLYILLQYVSFSYFTTTFYGPLLLLEQLFRAKTRPVSLFKYDPRPSEFFVI